MQNKVINAALNSKANLSDIPSSLPANGGRADVANVAYHQVEHFLESGTDVLAYVTSDNCPAPFNTIVRIMNSPTCPTNYGYSASDNDFVYHIFKLDSSWSTVKAYDWRGNYEYMNSCLAGTWSGWIKSSDGGNASTVNGLTVQTAVPANAKFTDTTYGAATTSANGLMSAADKTKLNNTNIAYATCSTDAATAAKVATISGNSNWTLAVGSVVTVKFSNTNTASNCTLNVNNTGAKQIWYNNAVYTAASVTICGFANRYIRYMYDGTYWIWIGASIDNYPGDASASAAGVVTTGVQTFAGNKTFNGQILPAGASAVGTAQARKIYAGTSDMTAGTTALETGAIYLVYE